MLNGSNSVLKSSNDGSLLNRRYHRNYNVVWHNFIAILLEYYVSYQYVMHWAWQWELVKIFWLMLEVNEVNGLLLIYVLPSLRFIWSFLFWLCFEVPVSHTKSMLNVMYYTWYNFHKYYRILIVDNGGKICVNDEYLPNFFEHSWIIRKFWKLITYNLRYLLTSISI
jgi:hypothetical protein